MNFKSWLSGLNGRTKSRKQVHAPCVGVESVEPRQLLSISALFLPESGELNLILDSDDNVRVSSNVAGNVQVDVGVGSGPYSSSNLIGTLPASQVRSIVVLGGDSQNTIDLGGVASLVFTNLQAVEVDGANGHDSIVGSFDVADSLIGGNGDDTITGQGGNDTLIGGDGADVISAGLGNDSVRGGDGNDAIIGGAGNDEIDSGNGEDTVSSGDGNDSVFAGNGEDFVTGDAGNDTLNGDGGVDTVLGGDGNDLMLGGELSDSLEGGAGNDTLLGNAGNDTLIGVTGADQIDGGVGNDLIKSALDVPVDDAVPAAAQPAPAVVSPVPLTDAVDSTLGIDTTLLSHTIGAGAIDGGLTVQVTSTGAFGSANFPTVANAGAMFNPVDTTVPAGNTVLSSDVYFRTSTTSGARNTLETVATNRTKIRGTANEANSTFNVGSLQFSLTQTAEPAFDLVTGLRIGSLLTQTYHVTNTGTTTSNFELSRLLDGNLRFGGSATDGGGRVVSATGDEILVETDAGGTSAPATFVGITAKGGTISKTNRFEINQGPALLTNVQTGLILNGQVFNDAPILDQSIDTDYDVSLGLRNAYSLAPNTSAVYTTHTVFGTGTPNQVQLNQKPIADADASRVLAGRDIAVDVVTNDSDADGSLDFTSLQIAQPPVHGTAIPLQDGRIRYIPNVGYSGNDSFYYTIADNLGARSSPTLVSMTVSAVDVIGDVINAGLGNDTVRGGDGDDTILGGAGQDSLLGGPGDDRVQGQGGDDSIIGGGGADTLDGGTGNDIIGSATGGVVVVPNITISGVTVDEGNTGTAFANVIVTLSEVTTVPVSVLVSTADNIAQGGIDFTSLNLVLTIAAGQTTGTIAVPIIGDAIYEADENFFVNLAAPVNGTLINGQATITLTNDDVTAATQVVFIDFDSQTTGTDHVYTASERTTIIDRMNEVYGAFPVTITATAPAAGSAFNTIFINLPPPGGLASEIDFRNTNLTSNASVDINGFLGTAGQPPATSANFAELTFKVIAHENGHLMGLRHDDSFGPIGSGISSTVAAANFTPPYPGPNTANESTRHIMGSPGATGETLFDAINNQFFGEREAVKLSTWAFGGAVAPEQATPHGTVSTAQPIQPRELFVPNTLLSGSANFGDTFRVNELTVTGAIGVGGEVDLYSFNGTAGQLLNFEIISQSVGTFSTPASPRYPNSIDSQIRILDASGTVIPFFSGTAINNDGTDSGAPDPDSILIDLTLPSSGTFFVEVTAATAADIGNYELYMYDFATYVPAVGGTGASGAGGTSIVSDAGDLMLGGEGNDTLQGAEGDDTLNGQAGNDLLQGGDGNDSLLGGAGQDTLQGQAGDDTLNGQSANDTLLGGDGNDIFVLDANGSGIDSADGEDGFNTILVNGTKLVDTITVGQVGSVLSINNVAGTINATLNIQNVTINTLAGNDLITVGNLNGVSAKQLIVNAGAGDDVVNATGAIIGAVRLGLNGNDGNDTINGSQGNDSINGGAGNDSLCGHAGNDLVLGDAGDDLIGGGFGNDTIDGGDGADAISGQQDNDSISGGNGNDTIKGDIGNDTLFGGAGDDELNGMAGDDSILGGVGQDGISGGIGNDTLDGGRNDDTINGNAGDDKIRGDHGNDFIDAGEGNNTVNGGDGNDSILTGAGNDFIHGGDGDDLINADGGDDIVVGGDGNDSIQTGAGNDTLLGGDGNDVLHGQGGTDTVAGQQGIDFISDPLAEIHENFVLPANILAILSAT